MFVVLEGADASGKTTLCPILANQLGARVYTTPSAKYLGQRERIDREASPQDHYRFYRDAIYDASDEIRLMSSGGDVICDRYWFTTYVYHKIMGANVSVDDFRSIIKPDLTVILSLDQEVQFQRMQQRGLSAGDRRLLGQQEKITNMFYQEALRLVIPFVIIDTKHFSPDQCANMVVAALE